RNDVFRRADAAGGEDPQARPCDGGDEFDVGPGERAVAVDCRAEHATHADGEAALDGVGELEPLLRPARGADAAVADVERDAAPAAAKARASSIGSPGRSTTSEYSPRCSRTAPSPSTSTAGITSIGASFQPSSTSPC